MQKGQHIGKIVIAMQEQAQSLRVMKPRAQLKLRHDRSYLFIGGLGGLGRSIATYLVEHGARSIAFFSRSAAQTSRDDPYIRELETQGCSVQLHSGSVYNQQDVERVIQSLSMPVGGVLQASMVLEVFIFPL